ncbi:MAG: replicative DNA helicase [Latescibacteria bacterium DG_63]|nr:MAG: replicative DNA helicase [Latescibacteria bacterium DG_63]
MKTSEIDAATGRVPPQSIEAEQSVLGAMLIDARAVGTCLELIKEDDNFYREGHRKIFRAITAIHDRAEPVDLVTLSEELRKRGELEQVGGASYLASLLEQVATAANAEYYCRIVLEKAILRKLIDAGTTIATDAYGSKDESGAVLDRAEQLIFGISDTKTRRGFVALRDILGHSFEVIQELYDKKRHVTGVESGFIELDSKTAGFQPSDLIVIAGRPSMGKTSLCMNVAQHLAIRCKTPVAIFSLEMSREQVVLRMLCSEARVDAHRLRTGYLREAEWPLLTTAAGQLSKAPIYVDDTPAISVLEMRSKARRLKSDVDIGLIIVDYLQLVRGFAGSENRQQEISQISRALKALAKELEVPVMALSQLSRAVEARGGDRKPVLSDLRESGAIEQDADVVIFIYRPEVYERTEENRGKAQLIIGKQRNGPIGTVDLAFISEYTRFESISRIPEEPF